MGKGKSFLIIPEPNTISLINTFLKRLYDGNSQLEVDIKNNVFIIDSTTIDLCLSIYPWAKF